MLFGKLYGMIPKKISGGIVMSGYYSYGQSYGTYYPDEWLLQLLAGVLAMVCAFALLVGLALYVLRAVGLYKLAKNRAIRCAWLAWVPVASDWILGSVSDQYQYVVKGRIRNNRLILLILSAVSVAFGSAVSVLSEEVVVNLIGRLLFGGGNINATQLVVVVGLTALCAGVRLVYRVFSLMAHFDLYRSCTDKYSVIYLVLAIFFRFLEPVFMFLCRNKDEGMPPRKTEPARVMEETVPSEQPQSEACVQAEQADEEETPVEETPAAEEFAEE